MGNFEPDDYDYDGDSDLVHLAPFQLCFSGDGGLPGAVCSPWTRADTDGDVDVDLDDYANGMPETNTGPR